MNPKNTNIAIALALVVVVIFVALGFFGMKFFAPAAPAASNSVDPILKELQDTGTVADLRTEEIAQGTGAAAKEGDTVTVQYTGVLPDGTVFDSSQTAGREPFSFTLGAGGVIQGWERGILGMQVGERRLLVIPPSLGYGAVAHGSIPPNSTLIFDVQIVSIAPATSAQ